MLPREKLSQWGVASLSLQELIAVILATGTKNKDVIEVSRIARNLLIKGNINLEKLESISGIGTVKAMKLLCSIELGYRLSCPSSQIERISSTDEAYLKLRYLGSKKQEYFVAIFLNGRHEVVGKKTVGIGQLDRVNILPRDIIIPALKLNSAFVIVAHNHPSGESTPTEDDIVLNERIRFACDLVGITLLDHLVISSNSWRTVGKAQEMC